jgi:hypothetical protein
VCFIPLTVDGFSRERQTGICRPRQLEIGYMATREKRLAQFDGNGDPPQNLPLEVLCEDHSGTYQLPFACRWIDGRWRNDRTGGMVEATVVGWRHPRSGAA